MERIIGEENDSYHNIGDVVEGPVVCVCREEVLQALNEMNTGKDPGPSEVSLELIAASGAVRIHVMTEICQKVLDRIGMSYVCLRIREEVVFFSIVVKTVCHMAFQHVNDC